MAETELENKETAETETTESTTVADTTVYTPEKQMLDQERANTRRAREELASVSEAYDEANERLGQLEQELEQLKTANEAEKHKLETQQQRLEDMDPELVDGKVIANIRKLEQQLKDQESQFQQQKTQLLTQLKELSNKATTYEQQQAATAEEQRRVKVRENVLNRVEKSLERHGIGAAAKYRTEALKLADELVDSGQVKQPQDVIEAVELMEDCYLKIKAKHDKGKGKTVSVDTGKSGVTAPSGTARKSGTLDEIADDMLKDKSWLKD